MLTTYNSSQLLTSCSPPFCLLSNVSHSWTALSLTMKNTQEFLWPDTFPKMLSISNEPLPLTVNHSTPPRLLRMASCMAIGKVVSLLRTDSAQATALSKRNLSLYLSNDCWLMVIRTFLQLFLRRSCRTVHFVHPFGVLVNPRQKQTHFYIYMDLTHTHI